MKIKLYTKFYDDSLLKQMNPEAIFTSEEQSYASKIKFSDIFNSKDSVIRNFLSGNYLKLDTLGFLVDFICKNKYKNIVSMGAGPCVLEYLLRCSLAEDSIVVAADFNSFLIDKARGFFPEIISLEYDFFKDSPDSLKNKLNINLDLAVFWGSAYTMDDEDFIRQFSGLKKIGVKNIVDFHAGYITDKAAFKINCYDVKYLIGSKLKKIKTIKDLWRKIQPIEEEHHFMGKFHGYGRTRNELRRIYKRAGLSLIKEFSTDNYRYVAILA